jgi:hypothetical protein
MSETEDTSVFVDALLEQQKRVDAETRKMAKEIVEGRNLKTLEEAKAFTPSTSKLSFAPRRRSRRPPRSSGRSGGRRTAGASAWSTLVRVRATKTGLESPRSEDGIR